MHVPAAQTALVQPRPRAPLEPRRTHVPTPGPGRVVVRVATSTVNPLDHKVVAYAILAHDWPWVGGNEYAGTVAAVGPSVDSLRVGDRVVAAAVNFIEGPEVSGWQEYALLRADLCAKIPDHVPFDKAAATPTAFVAASIAIGIELGLKYPDPPPAPPKQSAASIWENAMAALGNGATFGWDLEQGVVSGGVWYPNPKAIQAPSLSPDQLAQRAEAARVRLEEEQRLAKEQDRLHAELSRAMADEIAKARAGGFTRSVPGYAQLLRQAPEPVPRSNAHPMLWGAYDMSREAMDKRWGSGWERGGAHRRFDVVEERRNSIGLGLVTNGLGLNLGPSSNGRMSRGASGTDSASTSASMGRSGSDDSNTSVSASEMWSSYPCIPPLAGRRGSEPSLGATWTSVGSAPLMSAPAGLAGSPPARPRSGASLSVRSRSSGSAPPKSARSQVPGPRGSTLPFRVPAALSHRGRGSPPYRVREQSPLGVRFGKRDLDVRIDPARGDRHVQNGMPFAPTGAAAQISGDCTPTHRPFTGAVDPWSGSASSSLTLGDSFFPPPLAKTENPVHVLDEPILIWGGSTCVGRSAVQLLKRAGYANLFVVAASERHGELAEIAPHGTRFFDYHHSNVVAQIRTALGTQKLEKVLDTVSMPYTLEPISQLVSSGAKVAALLPVHTPMPEGVHVKPVMFGRCNDYTGKDVLSFNFGKEKMWPLLAELLRKGEWVFPPTIHLSGGLQACATSAMQMMSSSQHAGKRLVFDIIEN